MNWLVHQKGNIEYRFSQAYAYLLSRLSGISEEEILRIKIYKRYLFRPIPFYDSHKGGGAITLASRSSCSVTYTENFFDFHQNPTRTFNSWTRLSCHELMHLRHGQRFYFLIIYLIAFVWQYMVYGHDNAPLEIEADKFSTNYDRLTYLLRKAGKLENFYHIFVHLSEQGEQIKLIDRLLMEVGFDAVVE